MLYGVKCNIWRTKIVFYFYQMKYTDTSTVNISQTSRGTISSMCVVTVLSREQTLSLLPSHSSFTLLSD